MALADWLVIMNERVFFFARQKELTTLLSRYQHEGQDLIVFDTARLIAAAADRVEVATVNSGEPVPWGGCACRGRDTFVPLARFGGKMADIEEVTVVAGLVQVSTMVVRSGAPPPRSGPRSTRRLIRGGLQGPTGRSPWSATRSIRRRPPKSSKA